MIGNFVEPGSGGCAQNPSLFYTCAGTVDRPQPSRFVEFSRGERRAGKVGLVEHLSFSALPGWVVCVGPRFNLTRGVPLRSEADETS